MRYTLFALVLSWVTVVGACAPAGSGSAERRGAGAITLTEVDASSAQNAYELVRSLRPTWLQVRGRQNVRDVEQSDGLSPGETTIVVYLDHTRLGNIDSLRSIPKVSVQQVEWITPAAATTRWGAGHLYGAILVTSR